jgi:hypothetical protein
VYENSLFYVKNFGSNSFIVKYDIKSNKEICKSQLVEKISTIEIIDSKIFVTTPLNIHVFDLSFNYLNCFSTGNYSCLGNKISVYNNNVNDSNISVSNFYSELWTKKIIGFINGIYISNNFVLVLTDRNSLCFDLGGKVIWNKNPYKLAYFFYDGDKEYIIMGIDKRIDIFEAETGIMVWSENVDYPVCGKISMDNNGFAVLGYNGGGITFFGRKIWETGF